MDGVWKALLQALKDLDIDITVKKIDVEEAPEKYGRTFPSPTILLDGHDIYANEKSTQVVSPS